MTEPISDERLDQVRDCEDHLVLRIIARLDAAESRLAKCGEMHAATAEEKYIVERELHKTMLAEDQLWDEAEQIRRERDKAVELLTNLQFHQTINLKVLDQIRDLLAEIKGGDTGDKPK